MLKIKNFTKTEKVEIKLKISRSTVTGLLIGIAFFSGFVRFTKQAHEVLRTLKF